MVLNERKSIGPGAKYSKNHQSTYHWVPNDESPKFQAGARRLYTMAVEKDPFLSPVFKHSRNLISKTQMSKIEANSKKFSNTERNHTNLERREGADAMSPTSSNVQENSEQKLFRSLDLNSNFKQHKTSLPPPTCTNISSLPNRSSVHHNILTGELNTYSH